MRDEGVNERLISEARRALRRLAYPLARMLLRYGVSFEEFAGIAKRAYVEVAAKDFSLTQRPSSKSRIALLTGLNRREVARVLADEPNADDDPSASFNRSARIVSTWVRDRRFHDAGGEPAVLPLEGEGASLDSLVRTQGSDIPVKTVLRELKNAGAVQELPDGRLRLLTPGYIPAASEIDKLQLLGTDVAALLATIDNNLSHPDTALFQRKVSFPRLSDAGVALLKRRVREQGLDFLLELDRDLAKHDQADADAGHFAGLGMYVFVRPPEEGN